MLLVYPHLVEPPASSGMSSDRLRLTYEECVYCWSAFVCRFGDLSDRIAAVGYCFGGMSVLDLARMGAPRGLRAVASLHGILVPISAGAGKDPSLDDIPINPRILILHASGDPFVPPEQVRAVGGLESSFFCRMNVAFDLSLTCDVLAIVSHVDLVVSISRKAINSSWFLLFFVGTASSYKKIWKR